ncbi:MAG: group II truncated hemoglobin [Bdellovibrionaceae bacterium]|nr:group II truncated hemoglobin [Pseudobdellovibrionaceae bacterium]
MSVNEDTPLLYDQLGGETGLRRLVDRFYHHMSIRPESAGIRRMHPDDISISAQKLYEFLSGWSGGPPLFTEKYGHPRLRARHLPFSIGKVERDQWMICMLLAVEDVAIAEPLKSELLDAFLRIADHMRNLPEPPKA